MKGIRQKNTKERGLVEFFIYPEGRKFIGVCLTFDIIEEGKDQHKLMESLNEAAFLHLKVVVESNLPDDLLNRYAPEEYWDRYLAFQEATKKANMAGYSLAEASQRVYSGQQVRESVLVRR